MWIRWIAVLFVVFGLCVSLKIAQEAAKEPSYKHPGITRIGFIQYVLFITAVNVWLCLKILTTIAFWKLFVAWLVIVFFITGWLYSGFLRGRAVPVLVNLASDLAGAYGPVFLMEKFLFS